MTILHKLFVRVHFRYTHSPHVGELSAFAQWLIEREYHMRNAQRLVHRAMRSLEVSGFPPDRMWTEDELDRAFHHRRYRHVYRQARHSFSKFLQSVGRLISRRKHNPHEEILVAYRTFLSDVRGLKNG